MSGLDEERKTQSRSPFDEQTKNSRFLVFTRPLTAKKLENDTQKVQRKSFGRYNTALKAKKFLAKDRNSPLIAKSRPKKASIERERLQIENMELKLKNNELSQTLMKYKAKVINLERDKNRKSEASIIENPSTSSFLVNLLKKTIKDLKSELSNKENEISRYKKSLKYTKIVEMELEIKAYIDECTRLKHHLEEILENENDTETMDNSHKEKFQNLVKVIEDNQKEIQKLRDQAKERQYKAEKSPNFKEEVKRYVKEIEGLKNLLSRVSKENEERYSNLQRELQDMQNKALNYSFKLKEADKLIENLYLELKSTRQKKTSRFLPPKCLQALFNLSVAAKMPVLEMLKQESAGSDTLQVSKFLLLLQKSDGSLKITDLDRILIYIQGSQSEINVERLNQFFSTFDFSLQAPEKETYLHELVLHLRFRLQLHRIQKSAFFETVSGPSGKDKSIHLQELVFALSKTPFNFSRQDGQQLSGLIFGPSKSLPFLEFRSKFDSKIGEWEVFSQLDEESFDSFLLKLISVNAKDLLYLCESQDPEDKEYISISEFDSCMESLKLAVPEKVYKYILVLFYSNNLELNKVPYKQFIQAYATSEEKSHEGQKEDLIFRYLEEIAQHIQKTGKKVREVFKYDLNGHILAEDFISGLNLIGIPEIPKDHLLELLENLQNNKEERVVCISIRDLEDIMENYGVSVADSSDSEEKIELENLGGASEGHVQKVSLLDTSLLEFEDS